MRRMALLCTTLMIIILAGCSGDDQSPAASPSALATNTDTASPTVSPSPGAPMPSSPFTPDPSSGSPSPAGPSPADLRIAVNDGSGTTTTWTLTCDPAGGTHPDPEAACAALDANGTTALAAVAKDRSCTQIYGGPQTATITGTWRGEPVNSTLKRNNGCEIARWAALEGLLPTANS